MHHCGMGPLQAQSPPLRLECSHVNVVTQTVADTSIMIPDVLCCLVDPADTIKAQQQVQGVTAAHAQSRSTLATFQQVSCKACDDT